MKKKNLAQVGRKGATLIELLAVIAVVVLLLAILFSAYPAIRDASERSHCVANLRQIGALAQIYTADNDGLVLPFEIPYVDSDGNNYSAGQARFWPQLLGVYIGPAFDYSKNADGSITKGTLRELACPKGLRDLNIASWNPTYALFGSSWNRVYMNMVQDPGKKVHIADSPFGGNRSHWRGIASREPSMSDIDYANAQGFVFRHRGRANMLFLDGHVGTYTLGELPLPPSYPTSSHEYRTMFDWLY